MHHRTVHSALGAALVSAALLACGGDAATEDMPAGEAAPSSVSGSGDADLSEIRDYELSMGDVEKWGEANHALQRLAEANPELATALESDDENGADQSLDGIAQRIESVPQAREVIEDAGLNAREYAVITFALFQAGMAQYAVEQGQDLEQVARDMQVNADNIRFMQEHREEIERLRTDWESGPEN